MKYIRTKDGIFELIWDITEINGKRYINIRHDGLLYREEILNQANTIPELCDCCVCFIKDEYQPYICPVKDIEHLKKLEQFGGKIGTNRVYEKVYLAIWTDKGLIYVAEMNNEGELELL